MTFSYQGVDLLALKKKTELFCYSKFKRDRLLGFHYFTEYLQVLAISLDSVFTRDPEAGMLMT